MRTLKHLAVAVVLAVPLPLIPAQAGIMSGEDLIGICEPAKGDPVYRLKLSQCAGYILGVADTFDCNNKTLGFTWDSTKYNNQRKLVSGVLEWLHLHPNVLHYQASGLVASALSGNYPCPASVATQ
jgi:hypothetical protein